VNGWVAADAYQGSGDIYLAGPGGRSRRLDVAGSESASDACPAWSPDGTRLLVARLTGPADSASTLAELVVVPVRQNGTVGRRPVIPLEGFDVRRTTEAEFDAHPCAVWAPDGRWAAFAGAGEVWVVNTRTGETRRLPDRRPSDLEWRPGTDQLTIAGDMGLTRGDPTLSTPVTVYSVSTGRLRRLGAVEAALVTWSPDGMSLAYTGGERDPDSRVLAVADRNGANIRVLVADIGSAIHGIGPVWSPTGERIAYQRCEGGPGAECSGEAHEVVLVDVEDGAETVIAPPTAEGHVWYPFTVAWSPDGTSLLYAAWHTDGEPTPDGGKTAPGGVVAFPADRPDRAQVLVDAIDPVPDYYSHRWAATQMWGREPG
jgi:Tol biopolymer transport system component